MTPSAQEIGAVLGFSIEELGLNRTGIVSSRQLWHVSSTAAVNALIVISMTIFIVGVSALSWKTMHWALKIMPAVFSAGGVIFSVIVVRDMIANIARREVAAAEGRLAFESMGRGTRMVVGAFRGPSPERADRAMQVLTVGSAYRVYYLARSDQFLSIEPIDPDTSPSP